MLDYDVQPFEPGDWDKVRAIYLEGIATRNATFETEAPTWEKWNSSHSTAGSLVAWARANRALLGWAALRPVSSRPCYAGVAEVSIYVESSQTGRGIGKALLQALIEISEGNGVWTLQGRHLSRERGQPRPRQELRFSRGGPPRPDRPAGRALA